MTPIRDLDRYLAEWLEEGPDRAPDGPIEESVAHARRSPRRPDPFAIFRGDAMDRSGLVIGLRLAALAALLAIILAGLAIAGSGGFRNGNGLSLVPTSASPTTPPATAVARPSPASPSPASPSPASPSPTLCPEIVPQSLLGAWSVFITGTEQTSGAGAPPGTWVMTFTACRVQLANVGMTPLPWQTPALSSTQLTLPPDPTCAYQIGAPSSGIYRFNVTATTLTFTKVSDSCPGRAITLSAHPWHRQSQS